MPIFNVIYIYIYIHIYQEQDIYCFTSYIFVSSKPSKAQSHNVPEKNKSDRRFPFSCSLTYQTITSQVKRRLPAGDFFKSMT